MEPAYKTMNCLDDLILDAYGFLDDDLLDCSSFSYSDYTDDHFLDYKIQNAKEEESK